MIYDFRNPEDAARARAYLESLIKSKSRCDLKRKGRKMSTNMNAYFHVVLTAWGGHRGMTKEEVKQDVKMYVCPEAFAYPSKSEPDKMYYHSWASLDSARAAKVTDKVRRVALELTGFYIPEPHETEKLLAMEQEASRYEAWQT